MEDVLNLDLGGISLDKVVESDNIGSKFFLETDVHEGTIKYMYLDPSSDKESKSLSLTVCFEDSNGVKVTMPNWIKGRAGLSYYTKDGKNFPIMGLTKSNALVKSITGKTLHDKPKFEDKEIIKFIEGKDTKVTRRVLTASINLPVKLAIKHIVSTYNGKTFHKNELVRHFSKEGFTFTEIEAEIKEPSVMPKWINTFKGKVFDDTGKVMSDSDVSSLGKEGVTANKSKGQQDIDFDDL